MQHVPPKHVWVDATGQWGEHAQPGVLVAWQRVNVGGRPQWQGWVIYASHTAAAHGTNVFVWQSWMDARHIRPVDAVRPTPDLSRYRPLGERPA